MRTDAAAAVAAALVACTPAQTPRTQPAPPPPIVVEQPAAVVAPPAVVLPPPAPAPAEPPAAHDPDGARGALPPVDARHRELALVRASLDAMYAHLAAKTARYHLDEDALFARADTRLAEATNWAQYDAAIYDALVAFHDGHLTYHPPSTAAPSRGYDAYDLGITTVLAGSTLLVASVAPGSEAEATNVKPGDEVTAIDGVPTHDALDHAVRGRVWSRAESAMTDFSHTWTSVLYPKGDRPRVRKLTFAAHADALVTHDVSITPQAVSGHAPAVTVTVDHAIAVVAIRSLAPGKDHAAELDTALATARAAHAIVIDLRGNRGGVDAVGERVLADLVEGTANLGTFRVRIAPETLARRPRWKALTAEPDGFSSPQPLTVDGLPIGTGFHGAIAVVTDASCASTCEIVAAALRGDLHARIFGVTTAGSSGAPVEVTLPAGHGRIAIPTWDLVGADGHAIEGDGVVPDKLVVPTSAELAAGKDPPLDAALASVRGKP